MPVIKLGGNRVYLGEQQAEIAHQNYVARARAGDPLTEAEREEADALDSYYRTVGGLRSRAAISGAMESIDNQAAGYGQPPAGPGPLTERGGQPAVPFYNRLHDRARRTLDGLHQRGLPDHAAATCERLGWLSDPAGRSTAQRWLACAGSPEYERAFLRMLRDPQQGFAEFDDKERAAWREGRDVSRALGLGTGGGNFMCSSWTNTRRTKRIPWT